jgi:hypothetical protein
VSKSSVYIPLSGTELGTLWMAYQEKTMTVQLLRHLLICAEDEETRAMLANYQAKEREYVKTIEEILTKEGGVVPIGFGDQDVNADAPPLYNGLYEISFLRLMAKISMGLYVLHLGMSYREDVRRLDEAMARSAQTVYGAATELLLRRGALSRPPIVTPPTDIEFVEGLRYMKGQGVFSKARPINLVESAHLYQQLETNAVGFELMTSFAQSAQEPEAKQYFNKGREMARESVDMLGAILKESDMDPSGAPAGRATTSTTPVYSDKLMMYCTNLLANFGLGGNALGTSFSFRSDLPVKLGMMAAKVYQFAQEGGKIMIKHKWMEEPPQAENRDALIGSGG